MNIEDVRVAILRIEGTNCETESFLAFERLGAKPEMVHLKQLTGQDVWDSEKRDVMDFHIIMIPGGFSSGDYVRAGAIWAARRYSPAAVVRSPPAAVVSATRMTWLALASLFCSRIS